MKPSMASIQMGEGLSILEVVQRGFTNKGDSMISAGSYSSWGDADLSEGTSSCTSAEEDSTRVGQDSTDDMASRRVHFADELGGSLVSDVRITISWWDHMVFGPRVALGDEGKEFTCMACGHSHSPRKWGGEGAELEKQKHSCRCDNCGSAVVISFAEPAVAVASSRAGSSELLQFIVELNRGVEAVLLFPGVVGKKRRPVVLYTEDHGESLCWIETGTSAGASNQKPYKLPCSCLLEVVDKSGVSMAAAASHRNGSRQSVVDTYSNCNRWSAELDGPFMTDGDSGGAASSFASSRWVEGAWEKDGVGRVCVKLKWRPKPTFPVRKATLVEVKTRCSPSVFTRGMLQLRLHNLELDRA